MFNKETRHIEGNKRQEKSHRKWRSFNPLTINKHNYLFTYNPVAPLDPDPLPIPGYNNIKCNVNISECRFKYELEYNLPVIRRFNKFLNMNTISIRKNFKWKFLLNYSKAVQTNLNFKIVNTPVGVFAFNIHKLVKVYLPKGGMMNTSAQFQTEILLLKPPNFCYDHATRNYIDTANYLAKYPENSFERRFFTLIDMEYNNSWKNIKWDNCKDTMRYIFIWNNIIKTEDKGMTLHYKYKLGQTNRRKTENVKFSDFVYTLIYVNFLTYIMELTKAVEMRKNQGPVDKNTPIDLLQDERFLLTINNNTGYRYNEIKLKDIPPMSVMNKCIFHPFWINDEEDDQDYYVISNIRFQHPNLHQSKMIE